MARTKKDAPQDDEQDGRYSVVIDPQLVPKLKIVAAAMGMKAPSYINNRLAQLLDRELEAAMDGMGFEPKKK